jgi:hypothetical protein
MPVDCGKQRGFWVDRFGKLEDKRLKARRTISPGTLLLQLVEDDQRDA